MVMSNIWHCLIQGGETYVGYPSHLKAASFPPLPFQEMKSTKVQTLGAVALHSTTAYTDEASIIGLSSLNWAIV